MSEDWRSGLSYVNLQNEQIRQDINECIENMRIAKEYMESHDGGGEGSEGSGPRECGGLDRSISKLSALLGLAHTRQYHDDGCVVVSVEEDEYEGHDGGSGCEYAD